MGNSEVFFFFPFYIFKHEMFSHVGCFIKRVEKVTSNPSAD